MQLEEHTSQEMLVACYVTLGGDIVSITPSRKSTTQSEYDEGMHMFDRITCDPEILGGKPIVKGTRVSVEMILEWLGSGASRDEIIAKHPQLTAEDIRQATEYAAAAFRNDIVVDAKVSS